MRVDLSISFDPYPSIHPSSNQPFILGPDVLLHVVQVKGGLEPGVIGALVTVEQTTCVEETR